MLVRRLACATFVCAAMATPAATLSACGPQEEAHREGLAIELLGVSYNVLITRQLNVNDVEDHGYVKLPAPPPGSTYYGVFLEACNVSDRPLRTAGSMRIVTTQHEVFDPIALDPENPYAYEPRTLAPGECLPEEGSLASDGPAHGALLVFEIPLEASENRPLELEVSRGYDLQAGEPRELLFELDL